MLRPAVTLTGCRLAVIWRLRCCSHTYSTTLNGLFCGVCWALRWVMCLIRSDGRIKTSAWQQITTQCAIAAMASYLHLSHINGRKCFAFWQSSDMQSRLTSTMAKLFKYTPLTVANASRNLLRNLAASVHRALLDLLYTLPSLRHQPAKEERKPQHHCTSAVRNRT